MNFSFKFKHAICISALALAVTHLASCKKDDVKNPDEEIVLPDSSKIEVLKGATVYYDLNKKSTSDESSSTFTLSGMYGSTLKAGNQGYKLGYFDLENTKIEDIKLENYADYLNLKIQETPSLTIDASSAGQPASGPTWIIYDFKNNHAVYPTANRYVVLYKKVESSDNSYQFFIMQAKNITALDGNATYELNIKEFTFDIPSFEDSKAVLKTSTIIVPPSSTLYYDLIKDVVAEEETSTINLSGMYGSTLKPSTAAYKFGYFDLEGKTIDAIQVADLDGLEFAEAPFLGIDASSAGAPASGPTWIIYDFKNNHAVYPTKNRFIALYKGEKLSKYAEEVIIFNAENIVALNGEATYTLKVKHFTR